MNAQMKAIKACKTLVALDAVKASLGDDEALQAFAADHEQLLVELECFGPVPAASTACTASNDEEAEEEVEEEEYVPTPRKQRMVDASVAEAKAAVAAVESKAPVVSKGPAPLQFNGKLANLNWPVTTLRTKGKEVFEIPDPVYANVHYLMGEYAVSARYNELKRKHEIEVPNVSLSASFI